MESSTSVEARRREVRRPKSDAAGPLVLGPMLRYIGETDATVWVETSAPGVVTVHADGRDWAAPTFAVKGHHYALVVVDALEPGGAWDYTVRIDGALVWPEPDSAVPTPAHPHHRPRPADPAALRLVPHDGAARPGGPPHQRCRRPAHPGARPRPRRGGVARPRGLPRRPGLRRRHVAGDARVHRRPPRHRRAARGGDQGLRGVRPPLPAGVGRRGQPVAAVHRAQLHDLRRPRHPRRLEHVVDVARGDQPHRVVARAPHGRPVLVLGLPAHRQPLAVAARRRRDLCPGARGGVRRASATLDGG